MTASKTFNRLLSVLLLVCMLLSFAPAAYAEEPADVDATVAETEEVSSEEYGTFALPRAYAVTYHSNYPQAYLDLGNENETITPVAKTTSLSQGKNFFLIDGWIKTGWVDADGVTYPLDAAVTKKLEVWAVWEEGELEPSYDLKPTIMPTTLIESVYIKVGSSDGEHTMNAASNAQVKYAGGYSVSELSGNDQIGYMLTVTVPLTSGAQLETNISDCFREKNGRDGSAPDTVHGFDGTYFDGPWTFNYEMTGASSVTFSLWYKVGTKANNGKWYTNSSFTGTGYAYNKTMNSGVSSQEPARVYLDPPACKVVYTDGVADQEVFADQIYTVRKINTATPAFEGTPERAGYTFTGWDPKLEDTVTADVTYTATWSANTYNVSFDSNGGDTVEPITVTFDGKYGTLPSAGYIDGFQNGGWYLVDENGTVTETQINKRTVVTTARDHTLFQNRSIKTPNVKIALTTPSEDIADGYIYYWPADSRRVLTVSFVKEYNDEQLVYSYQWYKDGEVLEGENDAVLDLEGNVADSGEYKCVVTAAKKDDCTVVTTNEKASAELTQTVKILKVSNTVEYDANGGEGAPGNNFSNANYATVQSGQPTREGYTFTGWNTEADGSGDSYKGGDKYVFAGDVGNGAQKVVLYAQWSATEYTLTVAPNNGEEPYDLSITVEDVVGDMVKEPAWEGHDFTGWVDQDGSPVDLTATFTTALQSINGTWTLHEYIVPVDPCNGEDATDVTYTYEDVIGDKYDFETEPERKGYTFEGWVDQDGNPVDLEATYTEDLTAINGSWKGKTYTVTFKLKEGEGTLSFTSKQVVNGDPLGYTPRVEREDSEDYTFIGWYDENGKYYNSETIFDAARDVTLTGRWIKTIVVTGDESAPVLFALMMLGSLACVGAVILRLRKRKDEA